MMRMKLRTQSIYIALSTFLILTGSGNTILDNLQRPAIAALILICILFSLKNAKKLSISKSQVLFFIFIMIAFSTYTFAISKSNVIMYGLTLLLVFFATLYVPNTDISTKIIKYVQIGSFVIAISVIVFEVLGTQAVEALSFYFTSDSALTSALEGRSGGLSGHVAYAAYLCVTGASLYLLDYIENRISLKKFLVVFGVYFLALMFTGKRMMLLIQLFLTFVIAVSVKAKGKRTKIFGGAFFFIIAFTVAYNAHPEWFVAITRIFYSTTNDYMTFNSRTIFWRGAIQLYKEHPILGIGYHNYPIYDTTYGLGRGWDAHNMYLQVLAETGTVGGAILFLAYIIMLSRTIKLLYVNRAEARKDEYRLIQCALIIQLIYLLYGISGYPIYYISYLFAFMYCTVICNSVEREWEKMSVQGGRSDGTI